MSDLNTFREETRNWLEENCPPEMRKPSSVRSFFSSPFKFF